MRSRPVGHPLDHDGSVRQAGPVDDDDPGLPIGLTPASNGEFRPLPATPLVREVAPPVPAGLSTPTPDGRGSPGGTSCSARPGSATMLAVLAACSQESGDGQGGTFTVPPESTLDPDAADEALGGDEFVFDVQGHFLDYPPGSDPAAARLPAVGLRRRVRLLLGRDVPGPDVRPERHLRRRPVGRALPRRPPVQRGHGRGHRPRRPPLRRGPRPHAGPRHAQRRRGRGAARRDGRGRRPVPDPGLEGLHPRGRAGLVPRRPARRRLPRPGRRPRAAHRRRPQGLRAQQRVLLPRRRGPGRLGPPRRQPGHLPLGLRRRDRGALRPGRARASTGSSDR